MSGAELELEITGVAHGGSCVARSAGQVVFVRHTLPGERVRARVTGTGGGGKFLRADAVAVLTAAAGRVEPRCPYSGPGRCGGCDWQHVSLPVQRELKATVIAEQLARLAGITREVTVEAVPGAGARPAADRTTPAADNAETAAAAPAAAATRADGAVDGAVHDGLGWRTRLQLATTAGGSLGLHEHDSHRVLAVSDCPIAHPALGVAALARRRWPAGSEVAVEVDSRGRRWVDVDRVRQPGSPHHLVEEAAGRSWRVHGGGFWQVHPGAADTLVDAVRTALAPRPGESVLDLYAGAGLFAGALAVEVAGGPVVAVEGDPDAAADARRNLRDLPSVTVVTGSVETVLADALPTPLPGPPVPAEVDLVVLDPPRTGARAAVVREIAARAPRAIAYVACDPAALARDLASFATQGYALRGLRAFDLFPMTHHVECVALLERAVTDGREREVS